VADLPVHETRATAPYSVIAKPVSADCNLTCRYCYYRRVADMYPDPADRLMLREVLEQYVLQVTGDSGARAVFAWQGGEPLLAGRPFYEEAFRLQRRHSAPGQTVVNTLQTNGTLLDEEWCALLKQHSVLVGLSMDGPAGVHDRNRVDARGRGSHAAAERALKLLRKAEVEFNVLVVVSRANAASGREVLRYLVDRGVRWVQFIPCVERDADGRPTSQSVDGPAYGRFMCDVFSAWHPKHVGEVSVRTFDNIMQRAVGGPPEECVFSPTCGNAVILEANGDLYACDHFVYPDFRLGSILEAPIRTLVRREPCQTLARAKLNPPEKCAACPYEGLCYGGCPKARFDPVSRGFGDPVLCEGYEMLFKMAFEPLREIGWRAVKGQGKRTTGHP